MTDAGRSLAKILMILMLTVGTAAALKPNAIVRTCIVRIIGILTSRNSFENFKQWLLAVVSVHKPADKCVQQHNKYCPES